MGYIQDFDKELTNKLKAMIDEAGSVEEQEEMAKDILKYTKECVLESFRNGIMAAKLGKAGKGGRQENAAV